MPEVMRLATIRRALATLAALAGALCAPGGIDGPAPVVAASARGVAREGSAGRGDVAAAQSARTIALDESARLHLTSRHGFTLNEQGSASGSVAGTMYVHLTIVSTTRVVAEVNFYPRGGSISGKAVASYRRGSSTASFAGTMSIARGTGGYAHARGTGLSFSGTIRRSDEAIAVQVHGTASV
jgi:hypothetical protein